jgi:superfamily II DNA helicase RecQ
LHDTSLREIARRQPDNLMTLADVSGLGATKLARYGMAIIEVVRTALRQVA